MIGPFVQGFMLMGVLYYYSKGMMSLINDYYRDEFKTYLKEDPKLGKLRQKESLKKVEQEAMEKLDKISAFEGSQNELPDSAMQPTQPTVINVIENIPSSQGEGYCSDNSCNNMEIKKDSSPQPASGPPKLERTESKEYKPPPPTPDDEYKSFVLKATPAVTPSQLYTILESSKSNNIKTSNGDKDGGNKLISDSLSDDKSSDDGEIANQQFSTLNSTNLAKPMLKSINGGNYQATPASSEIGRVKKIAVAVEQGCMNNMRPPRVKSNDIYKWRANCKPKSVQELVQFWSGNEAVSESTQPPTELCNRN